MKMVTKITPNYSNKIKVGTETYTDLKSMKHTKRGLLKRFKVSERLL